MDDETIEYYRALVHLIIAYRYELDQRDESVAQCLRRVVIAQWHVHHIVLDQVKDLLDKIEWRMTHHEWEAPSVFEDKKPVSRNKR